jgi:hypothetical protein
MTIINLISIFKDYGYAHRVEQMPNIGFNLKLGDINSKTCSEFYNVHHFTWNSDRRSDKNFCIFEEHEVYDSMNKRWCNEKGVMYYFTDITSDSGSYDIFSDDKLSDFLSFLYTNHLCNVFGKQALRDMKLNSLEI